MRQRREELVLPSVGFLELLLALTERGFGLLLAGHVATDADDADRPPCNALAFELGLAPRAEPPVAAVALRDAIVDVVAAVAGRIRCASDRSEDASASSSSSARTAS